MKPTNERLFPEYRNSSPYVKDGINNYVVHGCQKAINPELHGTKVAASYNAPSADIQKKVGAPLARSVGDHKVAHGLGNMANAGRQTNRCRKIDGRHARHIFSS